MFDGLKDMGKLMKQANEMRSKMKDVQKELRNLEVVATAEGGLVEVVMTGEMEVVSVSIDEQLLGTSNKGRLEKALKAAFNQASKESKDVAAKKLSDVSGGLNIPGLG